MAHLFEAKFSAQVSDLLSVGGWKNEELENLWNLLHRFSDSDKLDHLEILRSCPKHFHYTPWKGRPWKLNVLDYMDGKREPPNVNVEAYKLRQKNLALSRRMQQDGWCQSTVQLLRDAFHIPGLHLASLLGPPAIYREEGEWGRSHVDCSPTQCNALQVDEMTCEPSHVQPCSGRAPECIPIGIDGARISQIIREGKTPLVEVPLVGKPLLELRVVKYAEAKPPPFIAISHVYAHKIGSKNNTVPLCQLRRLQQFLSQLTTGSARSCLVWMDVLCVPTAEEYQQDRKTAVSQIAQIFRDAEKVLVLDATLLRTSRSSSPVELSIRIIGSDWMRRVWTLEEAMMACAKDKNSRKHMGGELFFRLENGQISLGELLRDLAATRCPYARGAIVALEKHLTPPVVSQDRRFYPSSDSTASQFVRLVRGVEYRNTSKEGDEICCIAAILGLDAQSILSAPDEEKAMAFYLALDTIPLSVLFCNGLRIPNTPFRWALRFFLTSKKGDNPRKVDALSKHVTRFGKCKKDGLHMKEKGTLFKLGPMEPSEDPKFDRIWIKDRRSHSWLILEPTEWDLKQPKPSWTHLQTCTRGQQLVLMINPDRDQDGIVLCKINDDNDDNDVYRAEFLCQVYIGRYRKRKLVDVGRVRMEETTGFYRFAGTESLDGRSSTGRFRKIGTESAATSAQTSLPTSSYTSPLTPNATLAQGSSRASSQATPESSYSALVRTSTRAMPPTSHIVPTPAPSRTLPLPRAEKDKVRVYAEKHSIASTLESQEWILM